MIEHITRSFIKMWNQLNAASPITSTVRRFSKEILFQELGFESPQQTRWYINLCCLFKILNKQLPSYLSHLVPPSNTKYFTRNSENIHQLRTNLDFLKTLISPKL